MKIFLILFLALNSLMHAQIIDDDFEMTVKKETKIQFGFRRYAEDKYFVGTQNPRSFITRVSFITNFQLSNALLSRNPAAVGRWYFPGVVLGIDIRLATEIYLFRTKWFGMLAAGALEVPMLARFKPSTVDIYALTGDAALIFDIFLPKQWRLRIIPLYHQSTHVVDGYLNDRNTFDLLSYEFLALELYNKYRWFTFYGGVEITYNSPAERYLALRLHAGIDFRYPVWREFDFIIGIHVAGLYDKILHRHPDLEGWHPAVNFGLGFEVSRISITFKVSHQRSFDAATYHFPQTKVGVEFSIFL